MSQNDETTARILDRLSQTTDAEIDDYIDGEFGAYQESTTRDRRDPTMLRHLTQVAYAAEALEAIAGLDTDDAADALDGLEQVQVDALDAILADIEGGRD